MIENKFDAGTAISEAVIKKGLQELNSGIHFDVGGRLDLYHPNIERWQGIFYGTKNLGAMDRGVIPEYTVWHKNKRGEITHIDAIGWRLMFHNLTKYNLPGVTWEALCLKFNIDYKEFHGLLPGNQPAAVAV